MTPVEIERMLAAPVLERQAACAEKSAALAAEATHEKKALAVEAGMYSLCLRAGLLYPATGDRTGAIRQKATRLPRFAARYPAVLDAWEQSDSADRESLGAALYGEIWLCAEILPRYREELASALSTGEVEKAFEARIKVEVVEWVIAKWQFERRRHGVYPSLPGEAEA